MSLWTRISRVLIGYNIVYVQNENASEQEKKIIINNLEVNIQDSTTCRKYGTHFQCCHFKIRIKKGGRRHFVIRKDVLESADGIFYEQLLQKLNVVQYWHNQTFKKKRPGSKRRIVDIEPQKLRTFYAYQWHKDLSEKERACFHLEEFECPDGRGYYHKYVFNDPWRYELKIEPHIIYEVRTVDTDLESEIKDIDYYLDRQHLWPVILRQVNGYGKYNRALGERVWERNPLKNKPLHIIPEEHS